MKHKAESGLGLFVSFIKPYRGQFALDMVLSVIIAAVDLAFPYVTRKCLSGLLPDKNYRMFFIVMAIMFASYVIRALFQYFVTVIGHSFGTKVEADMRKALFAHMQALPFSFFDKNRTGALLSRVTNDLFEIVELAHHGPEHLVTCSLTIVGALVVLANINAKLTLVLACTMPVCLWFSLRQRIKMHRANIEVKRKTGEINSAIESSISGARTAKAFANEDEEVKKFSAVNEQFKKTKVGFYSAMGMFNAGIEATLGMIQVLIIAFGGFLIMRERMDYIDLITFSLYIATFVSPVRKLAQFMEMLTQGMAGLERFSEVMNTPNPICDSEDAVELDVSGIRGDICFDDVSFSYDSGPLEGESFVIKHFSLDVKSGEKVAFVGASGDGKTTLCSLLMRFYDVNEGSVSIDGHDVRSVTQKSLRNSIGIIQQDVFLFAGTIMENIRYGRLDATDDEVVAAAVLAGIHDEIMQMGDGYQTFVGEHGATLSGGQRQRVSIARVFLKNPPVLLLDEATSALDTVTESQIQRSLDKLCKNKTCIVIAHRLSTIRNVDRIVVIDDGRLAEQGTRDELLAGHGRYYQLECSSAKQIE